MKNSGKYLHAFLAVAAALLALASTAFAHTTVRSQATEATTEDNALKIGHGCETASGQMRPVIAQSAAFRRRWSPHRTGPRSPDCRR